MFYCCDLPDICLGLYQLALDFLSKNAFPGHYAKHLIDTLVTNKKYLNGSLVFVNAHSSVYMPIDWYVVTLFLSPVECDFLGLNKAPYNMVFRVITKTYLYIFDPLKPHFYIVKLGFTGIYIIFFLFLIKPIDCGNR